MDLRLGGGASLPEHPGLFAPLPLIPLLKTAAAPREAPRALAGSEQRSGYPQLCRDIPEAPVSSAAGHWGQKPRMALTIFIQDGRAIYDKKPPLKGMCSQLRQGPLGGSLPEV